MPPGTLERALSFAASGAGGMPGANGAFAAGGANGMPGANGASAAEAAEAEEASKRKGLGGLLEGLSVPQVAAGALAAVTSAMLTVSPRARASTCLR